MLKIYDPSNGSDVIPFPIADDKRFVTHVFNGFDTLTFEVQADDPLYQYIVEEVKVETEQNRFVIKHIDERSSFVTVKCDLDLDSWKEVIIYSFRTTNSLLSQVLDQIVPTGWKVVGADLFTKRTTVEDTEGKPIMAATPLAILDKASAAYECVFNFDTLNKVLTVINPESFRPSGQFFSDELNLKNLGFTGTSQGFATRLYAYGKLDEEGNPMTFAAINDGKPYVEDFSYSDKVVCMGWSDERYTDMESLLADAKAKLKEVSYPTRSYSCEAQNLDEDVWLYKVVTLIDRRRKTRVNHQIVEFREYPNHDLDTITLSTVAPSVKSFIEQVSASVSGRFSQELDSTKSSLEQAVENATNAITGNDGGHFIWILDAQKRPMELLNLVDSEDINTAKSVWRWNASGLGHSNTGYNGAFALALLADGSINASAIKTGQLDASLLKTGVIQSADGNIKIDLSSGGKPVFNTGVVTNGISVQNDALGIGQVFFANAQEVDTSVGRIKTFAVGFNSSNGTRVGGFSETFLNDGSPIGINLQMFNHDQSRQLKVSAGSSTAEFSLYDGETRVGRFYVNAAGEAVLNLTRIGTMKPVWKSNGDGTYTMIGSP